jgi:hypothetical protein
VAIQYGTHAECGGEDAMRQPREPRIMGILLILLAVVIYLIMMEEVMPLLWPYRDHPLVRVLLAFLSGGHLEELFQETGALL